MTSPFSRRRFLKGAAAGMGYWVAQRYARGEIAATQSVSSANEKLNVAVVGTHNRAGEDINDLEKTGLVNFVAVCDIDDHLLDAATHRFPRAKPYTDFRKMLDQKDIDAVMCGTPDHLHAWVTLAAMRSGRNVYCEKPLAHSLEEVRLVQETARKLNRVTQMGTQIHADENYRRVVELIQGNAIGPVNEVHVWISKGWYQDKPAHIVQQAPPNLHWQEWLGPVPERAYSPDYMPFVWRRWWAFGEGTIGDMACHYVDLPKWALKLGVPTKVRAEGPPVHIDWCPEWLHVEYEFPERDKQPPVKLTWSDNGIKPLIVTETLTQLPHERWPDGVLFIGAEGMLLSDYSRHRLLPQEKFHGFKPPEQTIPPSIGHHKEWVVACMKDEPTTPLCNFSYAGPLTEAVLLGALSYRSGQELEWDTEKLRATNCPEADQFIRLRYRKGWNLNG